MATEWLDLDLDICTTVSNCSFFLNIFLLKNIFIRSHIIALNLSNMMFLNGFINSVTIWAK